MALCRAGSGRASWWLWPSRSYWPSVIRLGHGISSCPRPPWHSSSWPKPHRTSRPAEVKLRNPPPTSTTTTSRSPERMVHCSPVGAMGVLTGESLGPRRALPDRRPHTAALHDLHRLLAHLDLADLAGHGHREALDHVHVPRHLVVREPAPAEVMHVAHRQRLVPRPHHHPRHQLLAVPLVGHADHLHVGDGGMGVEELLDLAGEVFLPAADDHVLDPADDGEVAVGVHRGEVTGVHPPRAVDRLGRAVRLLPVAEHDAVAAGAQLA